MAYKGKSDTHSVSSIAAAGFIVTALDEIAWLFNLRGSDISFNPVFFSYAVVTVDRAILYIMDQDNSENTTAQHLAEANVTIRPYCTIFEDLQSLAAEYQLDQIHVGVDASNIQTKKVDFVLLLIYVTHHKF